LGNGAVSDGLGSGAYGEVPGALSCTVGVPPSVSVLGLPLDAPIGMSSVLLPSVLLPSSEVPELWSEQLQTNVKTTKATVSRRAVKNMCRLYARARRFDHANVVLGPTRTRSGCFVASAAPVFSPPVGDCR